MGHSQLLCLAFGKSIAVSQILLLILSTDYIFSTQPKKSNLPGSLLTVTCSNLLRFKKKNNKKKQFANVLKPDLDDFWSFGCYGAAYLVKKNPKNLIYNIHLI